MIETTPPIRNIQLGCLIAVRREMSFSKTMKFILLLKFKYIRQKPNESETGLKTKKARFCYERIKIYDIIRDNSFT